MNIMAIDTPFYIYMDELRMVGNRLKQIRRFLQLTQNEVTRSTKASQAAISRIEHGEEVYASVFISMVKFYSTHINIRDILNSKFEISPDLLLSSQNRSLKKNISRKFDSIIKELNEAHAVEINRLEHLKKLIMDI